MAHDDVFSTLNDLIKTCKDGEEGFRQCSEHISNPQLKSLFAARADGCAKAADELGSLIASLGGTPMARSSVSGSMHRSWVNLKAAVSGQDDKSILSETERGEDIAVASYRNALERDLPPAVRTVVEHQYQLVLRNHDEVKRLRDQARAEKDGSR
jgi:uncharacterized protein (TIGR02284 family)